MRELLLEAVAHIENNARAEERDAGGASQIDHLLLPAVRGFFIILYAWKICSEISSLKDHCQKPHILFIHLIWAIYF